MSRTEVQPATTLTSDRLAVAARDGLHLGRQTLGGLAGRQITSIAPDGDSLWVLVERSELFHVETGGVERIAALDAPGGVCVHAHRGRVFVGGDNAGLWVLEHDVLEPVDSFGEAPTRSEWHTPWGGPPAVFSMASHDDDLYVSVHVGGILHTSDGGQTWEATIDLHEDVHQVAVDAGTGAVWAATGTSGLAESTDRGRTWAHHTDGLHATYLLAVACTSAGVLVGASSGHAGRDGVVYLFDGTRFRRPEGLPDDLGGAVAPRHLAGEGDRAAVVTPDGSLYMSDDGGRRWRHAGGPLPSPAEVRITP